MSVISWRFWLRDSLRYPGIWPISVELESLKPGVKGNGCTIASSCRRTSAQPKCCARRLHGSRKIVGCRLTGRASRRLAAVRRSFPLSKGRRCQFRSTAQTL